MTQTQVDTIMDCIAQMDSKDEQIAELEAQAVELMEVVKAVAHIGIDWGYGKFELTDEHISKARKLYEQSEATKAEEAPDG